MMRSRVDFPPPDGPSSEERARGSYWPTTTVFVTHDQEEALEVADEIVVINEGRVEQVGTPDDLYDRPANDFVMSFLGSVARLGGQLVRPHDIALHRSRERAVQLDARVGGSPGVIEATVERVVRRQGHAAAPGRQPFELHTRHRRDAPQVGHARAFALHGFPVADGAALHAHRQRQLVLRQPGPSPGHSNTFLWRHDLLRGRVIGITPYPRRSHAW